VQPHVSGSSGGGATRRAVACSAFAKVESACDPAVSGINNGTCLDDDTDAKWIPTSPGCAAAIAAAYKVPVAPLVAVAQSIDVINQYCNTARSMV
jgi:hypothetical protein